MKKLCNVVNFYKQCWNGCELQYCNQNALVSLWLSRMNVFGTWLAIGWHLIDGHTYKFPSRRWVPDLQIYRQICHATAQSLLQKAPAALPVPQNDKRTSLTQPQGHSKQDNIVDWRSSSHKGWGWLMAFLPSWKEVSEALESQQWMKKAWKGQKNIASMAALKS